MHGLWCNNKSRCLTGRTRAKYFTLWNAVKSIIVHSLMERTGDARLIFIIVVHSFFNVNLCEQFRVLKTKESPQCRAIQGRENQEDAISDRERSFKAASTDGDYWISIALSSKLDSSPDVKMMQLKVHSLKVHRVLLKKSHDWYLPVLPHLLCNLNECDARLNGRACFSLLCLFMIYVKVNLFWFTFF